MPVLSSTIYPLEQPAFYTEIGMVSVHSCSMSQQPQICALSAFVPVWSVPLRVLAVRRYVVS